MSLFQHTVVNDVYIGITNDRCLLLINSSYTVCGLLLNTLVIQAVMLVYSAAMQPVPNQQTLRWSVSSQVHRPLWYLTLQLWLHKHRFCFYQASQLTGHH